MSNRFNLIDEPWVPVADFGRVSLRDIFTNSEYRALGGNPIQKIALMKLLLAIAQAACTPEDSGPHYEQTPADMAQACLRYLAHWHERFYLYGEQPFLQMPAIAEAAVKSYGAVLPEVSTGNTTVLSQVQVERTLDDAEKAVLLVSLMSFALGGKKTDNNVTLSPGYQGKRNEKGKPSTGRPGPSLAHMGLLHNFLLGKNIWQTLWLNRFNLRQIEKMNFFPDGVGKPPWEQMPIGEDCETAKHLKKSLMGRLVPLCRFCLLGDEGLHYSEGLAHSGYKEGVTDPSVAVNYAGKDAKSIWTNPEKRPWRELTALLSFLEQQKSSGFNCWQIEAGISRAINSDDEFAIWSGGLRVSSNAGEQYPSGSDDFVESKVWLHGSAVGELWFSQLQIEMSEMDELAKGLYGRVKAYFKEQKVDGDDLAAQASHLFWQRCERDFQKLVDACEQSEENVALRRNLRIHFAGYANQAYDFSCPKETARQLDAWAKCRPNHSKYLKQET